MESSSSEPKKSKSIEELTKEELLTVFEKLKVRTLQLSQTKTDLEQQLENSQNEKEDIRKKAQQVVLRCKDLEKKVVELEAKGDSVASIGFQRQGEESDSSMRELLQQANKDIAKYKDGFEQLAQKFKTLKVAYETKVSELEQAKDENEKLKSQYNNFSESQVVENGPSAATSMQSLLDEVQTLRIHSAEDDKLIQELKDKLLKVETSNEFSELNLNQAMQAYNETQSRLEHVQAELSVELSKSTELTTQVLQLRETLEGRESEVSASGSRVGELERELNEVRSELAATVARVGAQGEASAAREEEVSSLQALLSSEREKMASLEQELTSSRSEWEACLEKERLEVSKLTSQKTSLEQELSAAQEETEKVKTRSQKALEKLKEVMQSLKEKNEQVEMLESRVSELERSGETRQMDLDQVMQAYNETQSRLEHVQAELSVELSKSTELTTQVLQLRETLEGRESEVSASGSRVGELERELNEVRSELAATVARVGAQGEASAAREEEVSSLQALLSSEREKMASLEQEFTSCVVERDGRFSDLEGKLSEYKIRNSKALEKLKETISSLKEKSDEVCSLQERMTEIERLYGSRCEEFNSLSASYEEVSSQLQGSAEEVSALRHQVSVLQYAQDQWEHQCEDLRTLVKDNEKEKSEQAIILQSKLDSLKKRYEETPWRFTIVLRVRDKGLQNVLEDSQPGSTWCLLQRRDSVDSEPYYQWQEDATVIAWFKELCAQQILQKKVAASEENAKEALEADEKETEVSSFSISGNDEEEDDEEKDHGHDICGDLTKDGEGNLVLPDTLQDVSNCRLEIMKRDLQNQIEVLRGEVETNRIAFDRYRDRAKDTLRASIADQKELENKLAVYKEEVKQDLQGKEKLEKRSRMLEMQLEEQQRDYENKLQMEHQKWVDIAENLGRLEDENMKLQHLLTSLQNQQSQSSSHSEELEALKATHNEEMTAVADELHIIREKESQLEKEMKKRGDAARQMLTEKDKDIEQLRKSLSTLQQELKQLQQQPLIVPAAPASAQVDATVSSGGKRGGLQWSDNSADPGASYKLDDILSTEEKRIFDDIHHQESNASQNSKLFEEVYRRARLRETELLDIIKMLKNEVNSMRKRFSLIRAERQQFNSSSSTNLMNSSFSQQQHHQHHLLLTPRKTTGTPSTTKTPDDSVNTDPQTMTAHDLEFEGDVPVNRYVEDDNHWAEIEDSVRYDPEQEARLVYLKQAFSGFFRAKNPVEMQHLGRVICAILGVDIEEQGMIMEGITKLSPAVVATTTIDSITQQIASIFS